VCRSLPACRRRRLCAKHTIDPKNQLYEFTAETSAFPLAMIIRTSDMQILSAELGTVDLSAELTNLP
jgi:hypothetical protein